MHFSSDVFSDTVNDIIAIYPGKMENIKVRVFFVFGFFLFVCF